MLSIASSRVVLAMAVLSAGCIEAPSPPAVEGGVRSLERPDAAAAADAAPGAAPAKAAPQFVRAQEGEVVDVVRRAVETARADGRTLVVYVGASWCEPCETFHRAVERGDLDAALGGTRLLEFDADVDGTRLDAAGYGGRYIPRFVVPTDDGRPSAHVVEGAIKGEAAVDHIMKRLGPALARAAEGG